MSASWVVGGRLMLAGLQRRWQSAVALVGGGRAPHARSRGPSAAPGGAARTPARRRRWRAARARSGCCPSRSAAPPARARGCAPRRRRAPRLPGAARAARRARALAPAAVTEMPPLGCSAKRSMGLQRAPGQGGRATARGGAARATRPLSPSPASTPARTGRPGAPPPAAARRCPGAPSPGQLARAAPGITARGRSRA